MDARKHMGSTGRDVGRRRTGAPNDTGFENLYTDRGRSAPGGRVVDLRAVGDDCEDVALGPQIDAIAGPGRAADEGPLCQTASFVDRHGAEEVHVGHDVCPSQAVLRQGGQEVLAATRHRLHAVEHGVAGGAAATGDGIVMAAGVGHDREERSSPVRVERMALGQAKSAAFLDRVRRVVAFARVGRVVAQEIDALFTLQIDDAQHLVPPQAGRPRSARRHDLVVDNTQRTLFVHHRALQSDPSPSLTHLGLIEFRRFIVAWTSKPV